MINDVVVSGSLVARWFSADQNFEYVVIERMSLQGIALEKAARRDEHGGQPIKTENPEEPKAAEGNQRWLCRRARRTLMKPENEKIRKARNFKYLKT